MKNFKKNILLLICFLILLVLFLLKINDLFFNKYLWGISNLLIAFSLSIHQIKIAIANMKANKYNRACITLYGVGFLSFYFFEIAIDSFFM